MRSLLRLIIILTISIHKINVCNIYKHWSIEKNWIVIAWLSRWIKVWDIQVQRLMWTRNSLEFQFYFIYTFPSSTSVGATNCIFLPLTRSTDQIPRYESATIKLLLIVSKAMPNGRPQSSSWRPSTNTFHFKAEIKILVSISRYHKPFQSEQNVWHALHWFSQLVHVVMHKYLYHVQADIRLHQHVPATNVPLCSTKYLESMFEFGQVYIRRE